MRTVALFSPDESEQSVREAMETFDYILVGTGKAQPKCQYPFSKEASDSQFVIGSKIRELLKENQTETK